MSNLGRRLIGLLIAAALAAGIAAVSWPQLAAARQTGHSVLTGELGHGRRLGQTFRASLSGLYRVDVRFAAYARQNDGRVLFHLNEGPEGAEWAVIEVGANRIRDNAFHRFIFEPIADSSGREFYFFLEAPEAVSENAIAVWQTDSDSYPGGQAYVDHQPSEGDLTFVAYYRSSPGEVWHLLSERVRTWHPPLWRLRWLVAAAAAAWVVGVGVLLGELLVAGSGTE